MGQVRKKLTLVREEVAFQEGEDTNLPEEEDELAAAMALSLEQHEGEDNTEEEDLERAIALSLS